jgi:ectoine hydroxylase-related dioxygenase (phytanoyl-CoA dioxygenase family)
MTKNIRTCSGPQLGSGHDFFDGTSLLADHGALRRRAEADGYVYMKGLLDPKLVRSLRATVLELCASYGWLDDRYPVIEGVARPGTCIVEGKSDAWFNYYSEVLRLRELYALAWNDTLIETVRCILGHNVLPHPCSIARTKFPEATHSDKPPHQDYRFVGGTVNTWTVWIPCGDCPREVGGLAILPGSHTAGELPVQFRDGVGQR